MEKVLIIGFRVSDKTNNPVYFGLDCETGEEKLNGFNSIDGIREAATKIDYQLLMDINQ